MKFIVNISDIVENFNNRGKAKLTENYKKTDERILLIRNPHARWEPDKDMKNKIVSVKGKNITSWIRTDYT